MEARTSHGLGMSLLLAAVGCGAATVGAQEGDAGARPGVADPSAYGGCATGQACGGGTSCAPSMFTRRGAAQSRLCTVGCASGNVAACPGYDPGAATQTVGCLAPPGSSTGQCLRLCNPANGNRDCAPFLMTCAQVSANADLLTVCVP